MLRGRGAEVAAVAALSSVVTLLMAAPVLRAPSDRIFGMAIVGRHYDPFTVMEQFGRPIAAGVSSQVVTDIPGALLARVSGPVAAYNWLVLLSFPLSAIAAYLLARYLALSQLGATVAAMAYAFSPFHIAHAAYHPHIAQTQWIPLYLLALWRCLDRATPAAVALLCAAAIAVTFSNFYGGLIAVAITPIAVAAYWLAWSRKHAQLMRPLGVTVATLMLLAAAGGAFAWYSASPVIADPSGLVFPRSDLYRYSAKWWSYLVPPIEHPLLGATAADLWKAVGVGDGLLEQQVSLGWGIVALGLFAVAGWLRQHREAGPIARVPVLVALAVAALLCSLSPDRTIGTFTVMRPSAFFYELAPMFRSYARFGVVVQLMAALLAGIGIDRLRRAGTTRAQLAWVTLVALAVVEYAVLPSTLWRDVLPTAAHRWAAQQADEVRVLDCAPLTPESQSVVWLTGDRVTPLGGPIRDCADAHLPEQLAVNGFTHLLVRSDSADAPFFDGRAPGAKGLRLAARFDDAAVYSVTASVPVLYTATIEGFHRREHDSEWAWRWMGGEAVWSIVNTSAQPIAATLDLELSAFHRARRMELRLDGRLVHELAVEPSRRIYQIALTVPAGNCELVFHPVEAPTVADEVIGNRDPRRLSFALGAWHWSVEGAPP